MIRETEGSMRSDKVKLWFETHKVSKIEIWRERSERYQLHPRSSRNLTTTFRLFKSNFFGACLQWTIGLHTITIYLKDHNHSCLWEDCKEIIWISERFPHFKTYVRFRYYMFYTWCYRHFLSPHTTLICDGFEFYFNTLENEYSTKCKVIFPML